MVLKNTSNFQYVEPGSKETKINYISMIMFICQVDTSPHADDLEAEKNQQEKKFTCMANILREIVKAKDLSTEEIFSKFKNKDMMKLIDYENFIKEVTEVEIYFDDI